METFIYRIDADDVIVSVSDNWDGFAAENACEKNCRSESIVGHVIWDFIQDRETAYLYKALFREVREGKSSRPISFRCDSPEARRFLKLTLRPRPDGQIEIRSRIEKIEDRAPVSLLRKEVARSEQFVRICSMCKKVAAPRNTWVEIEEGITRYKLFEKNDLPRLTHGLCPDCHRTLLAEIDALKKNKNTGKSSRSS